MTDNNITPFQAIPGGKTDGQKPPPATYTIFHWGNRMEDVVCSEYVGYSMATELAFYVFNEEMDLLFMVPMSRMVYVSVVPGVYQPQANEIN